MTDTGTSEKWEVSEGYRPEKKYGKVSKGIVERKCGKGAEGDRREKCEKRCRRVP